MKDYYDDPLFYEAYAQGRVPFYGVLQYEDVKLYLDIAKRYSVHSILDLGCAVGRISIPLSEAGYEVTGVDNVEKMITIARERSSVVNWVCADINQIDLNKQFDLITSGLDFVNHFHDQKDLYAVLQSLYKHLADDGCLVIDTVHPNLDFLTISNPPQQPQLNSIFDDPHGRGLVYVTQKRNYNASQQVLKLSKTFHFYKEDRKLFVEPSFRIYFPQELTYYLTQNGFTIEKIIGDLDGSDFNDNSPKMIFLCRKAKQ